MFMEGANKRSMIVMKLALTSAFLIYLSGVASAADAVVLEPTPEVLPTGFVWTGGYVGVDAGYLWGDGTFEVEGTTETADGDIDGWLAGVYAGYNYQFANNLVLGLDADIAWSNADGFGQAVTGGVPGPADTGILYELNWTGAARMKVGYAMDRFLPYIAGGLAFGGVDATSFTAGVATAEGDDTMVGWTIGAGLEYAFTDNMIGRAEYRYTDLGDFDITNGATIGHVGVQTHDVRLGLAYKF
jgi:outer membrane immunogenic protein